MECNEALTDNVFLSPLMFSAHAKDKNLESPIINIETKKRPPSKESRISLFHFLLGVNNKNVFKIWPHLSLVFSRCPPTSFWCTAAKV